MTLRARTIYIIGAFVAATILLALAQPAFATTRDWCIQPATYEESPCPTTTTTPTTEVPATTTTVSEPGSTTTTSVNDYTGPPPTVTSPPHAPSAPVTGTVGEELVRTGFSDILWTVGILGAIALMFGIALWHNNRRD